MIHISSRDLASGSIYNGKFDLNSSIVGTYELKHLYIDSDAVPWIWSGVDGIEFQRVSDSVLFSVSLGQITNEGAAAVAELQAAFDAGLGGGVATVVWDGANNEWDVSLSVAYNVLWVSGPSTSAEVFSKSADESNVTAFSLSALDAENRPPYLELHIDEVTSFGITSRSSRPDFLLSLDQDLYPVGQKVSFASSVDELNVQIKRPNVSGYVCPISNDYDIVLQAV